MKIYRDPLFKIWKLWEGGQPNRLWRSACQVNSQIYPLWRVGRWHPCNLSSIGTLNSQSWIHKSSKLETEALIPWMVWLEILWSKGSWRVWIILTSICCLGFPASWPKWYPELMGFWLRFNETSLQKKLEDSSYELPSPSFFQRLLQTFAVTSGRRSGCRLGTFDSDSFWWVNKVELEQLKKLSAVQDSFKEISNRTHGPRKNLSF